MIRRIRNIFTAAVQRKALVVLGLSLITVCLGLVWVFQPSVEKTDPEPNYNYLWKYDGNEEMYRFQRPIVFPFILKATHLVELPFSQYLTLQYLLRSAAIVIFGYLVYLLSRSKVAGVVIVGILFLNLQVQQFINYLIPEPIVTFMLAMNFLAIYNWIKFNGRAQVTSNLIITFVVLTFTKPVFLYYPVIFLGVYGIVQILRKLRKHRLVEVKKLTLLAAYFSLFYILPVLSWSYLNYLRHDYFVLSSVPDLNFATRIMRFKLSPHSPLTESEEQLKSIFINSEPHEDIFWVWSKVALIAPADQDIQTFIGKYAKKTISENLVDYVNMSMKDWVYVTSHMPTLPIHFSYYDFSFNETWSAYMTAYEHVWKPLLTWRVPIVVLSVGLGLVMIITKHKEFTADSFFLVYAPLTWVYGAGTLIFSTDGDVVRQRSTVDDALAVTFVLLLVIGSRQLWFNRRHFINLFTD